MKKHLTIISIFWQRALTYRFTVAAYRVGELAETIVLVVMWGAIYSGQGAIKGFTLEEMVTYILIGNLINSVVRNFLADAVSKDIKNGTLSVSLLKPMSYFEFMLTREIGRMSVATILSFFSAFIVIALFYQSFILQFDLAYGCVTLAMIVLAFITELLISYLVGMIAFWTDETDGLYTTIQRLERFFSGGYFPLSLLPAGFVSASLALPFAYSFYVPAQLYLYKIDVVTGLHGLLIQLLWIVALYGLIRVVWHHGLKRYESVGM